MWVQSLGWEYYLEAQWLRLHASVEGLNLISGQGTKILHATQCSQNNLKIRVYCAPRENDLSLSFPVVQSPVGQASTECFPLGVPGAV